MSEKVWTVQVWDHYGELGWSNWSEWLDRATAEAEADFAKETAGFEKTRIVRSS
jgi:hypothetical protein